MKKTDPARIREAAKEYARKRRKHQIRVRQRVMERDGNKCQACGSFEPTPEAAHFIDVVSNLKYLDMEAAHDERFVLALCPLCHSLMDARRKILPHHEQYRDVLRQARASIQQGELLDVDGDCSFVVPTTVFQINAILRQLRYEAEKRGIEIRIISADYLAGLYLSGERSLAIGRNSDPSCRAFDIANKLHELVFRDFQKRCRFFKFDLEEKDKARKWGLKFSHRVKLWYCAKGVKVNGALKRREVTDLDVWLQTKREKAEREVAERRERVAERRKEAEQRLKKYGTTAKHIEERKKAIMKALNKGPRSAKSISQATGYTASLVRSTIMSGKYSLAKLGYVSQIDFVDGGSRVGYALLTKGQSILRE